MVEVVPQFLYQLSQLRFARKALSDGRVPDVLVRDDYRGAFTATDDSVGRAGNDHDCVSVMVVPFPALRQCLSTRAANDG